MKLFDPKNCGLLVAKLLLVIVALYPQAPPLNVGLSTTVTTDVLKSMDRDPLNVPKPPVPSDVVGLVAPTSV
jgi:hypothetical protein